MTFSLVNEHLLMPWKNCLYLLCNSKKHKCNGRFQFGKGTAVIVTSGFTAILLPEGAVNDLALRSLAGPKFFSRSRLTPAQDFQPARRD
jgi:hypothetical protein